MSNKNNSTCSICGKEYELCYSCNKKDTSMLWKMHCDTPNHYKIFQVINGYTAGVYSKAEAAKRLKNIDLSDIDSLRDNIKAIIVDIQASSKRSRKRKQEADDKLDLDSDNQS